ncbi:MAG TPA: TnsD family Tn7-like transposition protein [Allosphingosinicella sp.]|jgi:hypothetical protein
MTIGYVPSEMPDELLYSLLARLRRHRGVQADAEPMRDLFGRRHAIASIDLPAGLGGLAGRLPLERGLDVQSIVDRLTLFPFFTAFQDSAVRSEVRAAMAVSTAGIHVRLGIAAFRIAPVRELRFCLECFRSMQASAGERWWKRSHQLPGVLVCPEHGTVLRRSGIVSDGRRRHGFVAADEVVEAESAPAVCRLVGDHQAQRLRELAVAAFNLLERPPAAASPLNIAAVYRDRLAEVGLMRSACKVDQAGLEVALTGHWGEVLSIVPGLVSASRLRGDWLASLVRRRPRAAHPICHLLLSLLLESRAKVVGPFGRGPWDCRNPLSGHFGRPVIERVSVRRDGNTRYGDFRCDCGYVYTRAIGPGGKLGLPRYRSFGPLLPSEIRRAVAAGEGLRATSKRVGLDPKTLVREARMSGIEIPWSLRPSGTVPAPRVSGLVGSCGWTHRAKRRVGAQRIDWSWTDRRLAKAVSREALNVLQAEVPTRVTFAELERRVASNGWIAKRRRKLPLTVAAIAAETEDTDTFRHRRLRHVVTSWPGGHPDVAAAVLRRAGLRSDWLPAVEAEIRKVREAETLIPGRRRAS